MCPSDDRYRAGDREITRLGVLNTPQKELLIVLGGSVFLWVMGSTLESWMRLPATVLSSAVVALGAVALLSIEEVIDWNDLRGVNWGVFFVIGAGLTLGDALNKTGASQWFADMASPLLLGLPFVVILLILIAGAFVLTQFMNNVTLGAIWAPILISLGQASGIAAATAAAAGHHVTGAGLYAPQCIGTYDAGLSDRCRRTQGHGACRRDCRHPVRDL